jgi:tetratricopeptide (TPR) repeat protein
MQIEVRDPMGGYETLEALFKATERPSATLMLETVRARLLAGKHAEGAELLARYERQFANDKSAALLRWKYERERGRLALRQLDLVAAGTALGKAVEDCGDDIETFLLAAEVAAADEKQKKLGERVDALAQVKLKNLPELYVIKGKLLLGKGDEAAKAYETAIKLLETASPRRQAQGILGRATVAYNREDDPQALNSFDVAIELDPSLYEAYLYYADIAKERDPKQALAKAKLAIQYNPDSVQGYAMVGAIAHKLKDKKLLDEMIRKVGAMAPNSEELQLLRNLR